MQGGTFEQLLARLKGCEAVIGIVGMSYVGQPLALRHSQIGYQVLGFDIDPQKVAELNAGRSSIQHIADGEVAAAVASGMSVTSDFARISEADAIILCVPTPLNKYRELGLSSLGLINSVAYLADVAAAGRDSRLTFVVIGSGATRAEVERRASELDVLGRNFFMYDRIPKRDVASAFAAAGVVRSLFADTEPMRKNSANKFFDSLAAGRPIASNYGGRHAELLKQAESWGGLAAAITGDSRSDAGGARPGSAFTGAQRRECETLAEERFSRDRMVTELEAVLLNVVNRPRS